MRLHKGCFEANSGELSKKLEVEASMTPNIFSCFTDDKFKRLTFNFEYTSDVSPQMTSSS